MYIKVCKLRTTLSDSVKCIDSQTGAKFDYFQRSTPLSSYMDSTRTPGVSGSAPNWAILPQMGQIRDFSDQIGTKRDKSGTFSGLRQELKNVQKLHILLYITSHGFTL